MKNWTQADIDKLNVVDSSLPRDQVGKPPIFDAKIIYGNVPSKSNSYRIGKKGLFKTKLLTDYEKSFYMQCTERGRNITNYFEFYCDVYYNSQRPDLDGSLKVTLDCLQKCGVIKNDNKCVLIHLRKFLDVKNPRIEYTIIPIS